jgi:hypothetical protein
MRANIQRHKPGFQTKRKQQGSIQPEAISGKPPDNNRITAFSSFVKAKLVPGTVFTANHEEN